MSFVIVLHNDIALTTCRPSVNNNKYWRIIIENNNLSIQSSIVFYNKLLAIPYV